MTSYEDAQKLISQHCPLLKEEEMLLLAALGRVNARDLLAPIPLPVFDNSAMDGFALRSEDTALATVENPVFLAIEGVVKAGDGERMVLGSQKTCRIMTGSYIPRGADTVLAKEDAVFHGDTLKLEAPVLKGKNRRIKGEEIKKNEVILKKGLVINPGTVGFLSALGIDKVKVYQAPRVALITTGSELVTPGNLLGAGKIYDANTPMICAALLDMKIRPVFIRRVKDDQLTLMKRIVDFSLNESDIVIVMGGVSVGDFDPVKKILADTGVETIFWKVSQKPGKPLFFGKKGKKLVFGLPGNPASVFTCFYEYVYPAIRQSMGYANPYLSSELAELTQAIKPDADKTLFIKSRVVTPLKNQKSHMLSAFCEANSFVVVPGSEKIVEKGEKVKVHTLPYALEGVR